MDMEGLVVLVSPRCAWFENQCLGLVTLWLSAGYFVGAVPPSCSLLRCASVRLRERTLCVSTGDAPSTLFHLGPTRTMKNERLKAGLVEFGGNIISAMVAGFANSRPLLYQALQAAVTSDAERAQSSPFPPIIPGTLFSSVQVNVGMYHQESMASSTMTAASNRSGKGVVVHRDLNGVEDSYMLLLEARCLG